MKSYLSSLNFHLSPRRGFIQHHFLRFRPWDLRKVPGKSGAGFTLIELLVVISIIGILSAFLLANFVGVRQRARDGVRKSDLRQIQAALELYRSDQGSYPATDKFPKCGESLKVGDTTYMKKIPCDPSNGPKYDYKAGDGNTTYSIIACLENKNDSQVDKDASSPPQPISCSGGATWQYTLQNP